MGFEEFQRQQKALKEAERQTKKATADLLAGYRGIGGDEKANEQRKKLAQIRQADRIKKQATANLLAGYRGHGDEKINEQQRKFAEERLAAMIKKKSLLIQQLQKNSEQHSQQGDDDKTNNKTNSQGGGKGVFVGGDVHGKVGEIQRRLAEQRLAEEEKAKRKLAEKQSRGFTIKRSKDEGGEEEEKDEEPVVQESNKDGEQDQPPKEQETVLEGDASGRVDQEGDQAQQPKEVLGGDVGGKVDEIQKKLAEQDVVVEKPKPSNYYKKPPTIPKPNENENDDDHRNTIPTTPKKNPKTEKLPTITFKKLRRKKIKLDFTFGLIHDVVTPAPSHEECTAAAAEIVPNGMNGKKTSKGIISYDPNFPPIVTSIDVDPKFREPDQVRYTVKGKIPLYLIVVVEDDQDYDEGGKQETPPTPMTPSLQGILNRDESFRPNSALKKQQPSEVIVGEAGGSQWKRVREAAGEENLDELLKTKKVEEGESEVLLVQN